MGLPFGGAYLRSKLLSSQRGHDVFFRLEWSAQPATEGTTTGARAAATKDTGSATASAGSADAEVRGADAVAVEDAAPSGAIGGGDDVAVQAGSANENGGAGEGGGGPAASAASEAEAANVQQPPQQKKPTQPAVDGYPDVLPADRQLIL